jgi:hypothetical protein
MMIDQPPAIVLGIGDDGGKLVLPGDAGQAHDMTELLRMAPDLERHPLPLAQAINHFAYGGHYRVIGDPGQFETEYKAKLAKEDPNAPWQEGVIRLRDFGVPNFATIKAPAVSGERLVFYAVDTVLGVPYKVECASLTANPVYQPVPLTALPRPVVPHTDIDEVAPPIMEEEPPAPPPAVEHDAPPPPRP